MIAFDHLRHRRGRDGAGPRNVTFFAHLRSTWAIALGYAASIWVHFLINRNQFH